MIETLEQRVEREAATAAKELLEVARLPSGALLAVGCSSSEIAGQTLGRASSLPAAEGVYRGIAPALREAGVFLCAQCCEHLNRAVVLEREAAQRYGYEIVCVVPQPKAGGSFATTVWRALREPVAVERVAAHAGMDIGGVLIGMQLRPVAVPVRLSLDRIGEALLLCARTRPKYIGGERAAYRE